MTSGFTMEESQQRRSNDKWKMISGILLLFVVGLLIAVIVLATQPEKNQSTVIMSKTKEVPSSEKGKGFIFEHGSKDVPASKDEPKSKKDVPVCGEGKNPNGNTIDLTEPENPGPFHDLTKDEMIKLRTFLENDPNVQAVSMKNFSSVTINSSYIFLADLWLPRKEDTLKFLNNSGTQPERQARVMMFRGDKNPPVVEELICGPLPNVTECSLLNNTNRRNPVEFSSRPFNMMEFNALPKMLADVDKEIGHILEESYNATFTNCEGTACLALNPSPTASGLTGDINERLIWFWGLYQVPYSLLHPTDFGFQLDWSGADTSKWTIRKVWYHGQLYDTLGQLKEAYDAPKSKIKKSKMERPVDSKTLYSTLHRRGNFSPEKPQRPPQVVEPDGKRYSIKDRQVNYLDWQFNFRMSAFSGPQLLDIRFQGDRIAYELSLSEIAAFYSGNAPLSQATDYVDSGAMSSLGSKSLVPGGDCPDSATFVPYTVWNQHGEDPGHYDSTFCIFEHNNGYPLRRHSSYSKPEGFYGGMLDSVLTLRSILVVGNYDYVIDFIFHQNGALEIRLMSTGYIQSNFYRDVERQYGVKIQKTILGNLHHHMFNLKADLDVSGTSNRYETLDIEPMDTKLSWDLARSYSQTKYTPNLKQTELEALYDYDINKPKYHIVHNDAVRNNWGERKAYSIHLSGMSKSLLPEGKFNEKVISWSRHQIAVTERKEEEFQSSSNYGMYDTLNPVVDFSKFYEDNDNITDKDLVFWLTLGLHHIPHTEDLPVTPTAGNHLTAMLLPNNYFEECPSMGSRDAIFVGYKDKKDPSKGVTLERNGNSRDQCILPRSTLEEDIEKNPDMVLESRRQMPTYP